VPPSPSSITSYQPRGSDAVAKSSGSLPPGG